MGNFQKTGATDNSRRLSVGSSKEALTSVSDLSDIDSENGVDDIQNDIEHGVAHPVSAMSELEERVNDLDDSWETESLLADMIEGLTDEDVTDGKPPRGLAYDCISSPNSLLCKHILKIYISIPSPSLLS